MNVLIKDGQHTTRYNNGNKHFIVLSLMYFMNILKNIVNKPMQKTSTEIESFDYVRLKMFFINIQEETYSMTFKSHIQRKKKNPILFIMFL